MSFSLGVQGARRLGLSALVVLLGLARATGQGLPSPLSPANGAPLVYCPPERLSAGPASPQHVLNVFLPRGAPPPAGWPVVVATGYGGGASVPPLAALSATGQSAPLWNLVAAGIAVVHFGTPGLSAGRGLWYPPGHPSGRYESFRPADDNPEKSAEWALQWVKVQTLHPFDLARVGLRGSSGGAVLAIRTAMGPERARTSGSAHVRASTRVAAILAIQPPTSAWALEQGPELTIPFPKHLEQAARPGVAATQLTQVASELQKDYSLMRVAFASAQARANNAAQPLCLVYGDPVLRLGGAVAPLTLDADGFPVVHDAIRQPLQHDSWFGYVFWKRLLELSSTSASFHAANSVFAMRDVNALAPPLAYHTRTYSGSVKGPNATRIGHDWLVARLKGPQPFSAAQSGPPGALAAAPLEGCDTAQAPDLIALRSSSGARPRLVLGLRGEPGARAWLFVARSRVRGDPCGLATRAGALAIDQLSLVVAPRSLVLASVAGAWTEVLLELPPSPALAGSELLAQALVTGSSRAGDGRVRLSNALALAPVR